VRRQEIGPLNSPHAWTIDLHSDRPFHPERFLTAISTIGGGATRSRGCFWLPTRPLEVGVWSGAGGELSIGLEGRWGPAGQITRITVTGTDGSAEAIREAFEGALLTDSEFSTNWSAFGTDGLEQWLGPISRAA
jgi:G3E family GTPase